MTAIPQQIAFDNYSYGQQTVLADGSVINNQANMTQDNYGNIQKTQYYQVNNGQTIQTFNANQTTYQNNNGQLISQAQPTVVNTTTYLQTPTYSPQALNETTTASNLMLSNAVVNVSTPTSASITTNAISPQSINIPNTVAGQQNQIFTQQTISPVEGNGMNFFPTLPIDNSMKNGQVISQPTTPTTFTPMPQANDQRYPSPPMGAVDINKNQCQPVAIAAPMQTTMQTTTFNTTNSPINIVNNTIPQQQQPQQQQTQNGYITQSISMNQNTIQPTQTQNGTIINGMNNTTYPQQPQQPQQQPSQNNGFQQYYNQSFTTQTIQGKGQQQTIISSTTNIASTNYPPQANLAAGNMNKVGQNNLITMNQNIVGAPQMPVKSHGRSYNKKNEPISLELALKRQKNTEAARRSRMRKVLKMETLENHVKRLEADNKNLSIRLAMLDSNRLEWETKEKKLLDKIKNLEEQLAEVRKDQDGNVENNEVKKEEELNKE
ncbi:hypothetical protein BCR32DRAFT_325593 [Anaeromyces robustus]|jgi:hypothetical protein|uniref:BZIP domain-containing protein n=1 Tax=Anaeromyces robustus TaxID=1754192 RepID=A0A1Y1XH95_9FUNG|nr:hypothetical protein BCR32DRAFT_325593 [Anaeromyces robustus]|eukprot:ORX85115.1 hypothetical protein BCR32DRAFT_325593 [Anaeromyces robustus]